MVRPLSALTDAVDVAGRPQEPESSIELGCVPASDVRAAEIAASYAAFACSIPAGATTLTLAVPVLCHRSLDKGDTPLFRNKAVSGELCKKGAIHFALVSPRYSGDRPG